MTLSLYECQRMFNMPFYSLCNSNVLDWSELCGEQWWGLGETLKGMCSGVDSKLILAGQYQEHKKGRQEYPHLQLSSAKSIATSYWKITGLIYTAYILMQGAFAFEMVNWEEMNHEKLTHIGNPESQFLSFPLIEHIWFLKSIRVSLIQLDAFERF